MGKGQRAGAGRRRAAVACTTLSAVGFSVAWVPALGQESGGPLFTIDVSTTLSLSDNATLASDPTGNTVLWDTDLTFGYESVTRTQSLRMTYADTFRAGDGPGAPSSAGFEFPQATLDYERKLENARLSFDASLNTRDLDQDFSDTDFGDPDDLIADVGTLTNSRLGFELETGLEAPLGTQLSLSQNKRDYSDTTDPDLFDAATNTGELALILRPDSATEGRIAYAFSDYEADNALGTERLRQSFTVGVNRRLDPITTIGASVGWTEIEETFAALPGDKESGITASLEFSRELSDGSLSAELSHDVTSAGGRTDLSLTRSFELPASELSVMLGATQVGGSSVQPTGRIAYSRSARSQSIEFAVSTDVIIDDESDVRRTAKADISYNLVLSDVDALSFDLDYRWAEESGAGPISSRTRATARATYRRELTRDWTLETGYFHRLSRVEGADTAKSNTVFVTLGREFAWRP